MTIYFAGGEIGAFVPVDAMSYELNLQPYYWDPDFTRAALYVSSGGVTYAESYHWTEATGEFWFHGEAYVDTGSASELPAMSLYDDSDQEVLRFTVQNSITYRAYYWNGSSFTQVGTTVTIGSDTRQVWDIRFNMDASGTVALYTSGTKRLEVTGVDLSALGVAYMRLRSAGQMMWTQIICADEPTIGWRLKTIPPTGAGASTDFTGTYAEVDEVKYADADFINSSTNGHVELFSHGTTVPTGYAIRGVAVTARAKKGLTGPANLQLALRSGSTTYTSSSQALDVGYGAFVAIWETDPATTADFTTSAIASLQFGVKAIT